MTEWIGAAEAAQRLGIKPASLYSYVSRGVLSPRRGSNGRASLFDAADVADLALRGRPRRVDLWRCGCASRRSQPPSRNKDNQQRAGHGDNVAAAGSQELSDGADPR